VNVCMIEVGLWECINCDGLVDGLTGVVMVCGPGSTCFVLKNSFQMDWNDFFLKDAKLYRYIMLHFPKYV
jgi:hypothetical protein